MAFRLHPIILLSGPPGCGKTTMANSLAQKLSIHHQHMLPFAQHLTISSNTLWSRFVGQSARNVGDTFSYIRSNCLSNPTTLYVVQLDEIETLVACRAGSILRDEVHDTVKTCNAVLTGLDSLLTLKNIILICTSNLAHTLDPAFLSRCGNKNYDLGSSSIRTRYEILREAVTTLNVAGLVSMASDHDVLPMFKNVETYRNTENHPSSILSRIVTGLGADIDARVLGQYPVAVLAENMELGCSSVDLAMLLGWMEASMERCIRTSPDRTKLSNQKKRKISELEGAVWLESYENAALEPASDFPASGRKSPASLAAKHNLEDPSQEQSMKRQAET